MNPVARSKMPSNFVSYLTSPGLATIEGAIGLKQYLCKNPLYGGNAKAVALIGPLRYTKEGGTGATMNSIVGGPGIDLALKGQGHPDTFMDMWNFMIRNKELVGKIGYDKSTIDAKYGLVKSPKAAIEAMTKDAFFGLDCIGFVANYLIWIGYLNEYPGLEIDMWKGRFPVIAAKADAITPLSILIWPGAHIALVDEVHTCVDGVALVTVCQSSTGGPKTNYFVTLTETGSSAANNAPLFKVEGGTPKMPVQGQVYVIGASDLSPAAYGDRDTLMIDQSR